MASPHRLFNLVRLAVVALGVGIAQSSTALAQAPDEAWRTLTTQHFRVTFPEGLEGLGRRAAGAAEVAFAALEETYVSGPGGRIDLLLTDHTDASNGRAQVTPSNRITIFARPPVDGLALSHMDDWLELVITHEVAHIFHLDYTGSAIGRAARSVFGRPPAEWPFFPGLATPRWVLEGLATWYESRLTSAGRVNGTFQEMLLRTAVLEGRFERLDQASGESPLWPGGNRSYAYGSLFFDHLLERYGEDRLSAFTEAVGGQWVPYRLDSAGRTAFGVSLSEAWGDWSAELRERYAGFDELLTRGGPVTEPERLTDQARWGLHPSVSPDGRTLVYTRSDGRSDMQIERQDPGGGNVASVGRTNGLATYSWMPNGRLLFAQFEFADPYRLYGDLYVMDLDGSTERVTRRARLTQPSVAPDGTWAVAVQEGEGTNGLARVDLRTGQVTELVAPAGGVLWAFPRLSPDGRWIAATRWETGAFHDVAILAADGRGPVSRVTRDRAIDLAPSWSPDGRWLVWASDRTGVMNVLGAPVDPLSGRTGAPVQLTNVRTGALFPSVDPTGSYLYFSGHHVDGWEVERLRFEPDSARRAPEPAPRFDAPSQPRERPAAGGAVEGYAPWRTLVPTYWEPRYREPVVAAPASGGGVFLRRRELLDFGLGAETTGTDLVGRHAYGAYAHVFTSRRKLEGGVAYSYRGLGNPVLTLSGEQTWSAGSQLLSPSPALDTLFVLERERRVTASATLLSTRWRRNVSLTLAGGLVWEDRELLGGDLQPSRLYRLTRPTSRLTDLRASLSYTTARSHSFQIGAARGTSVSVSARKRGHLALPDSLGGVQGSDRSFEDATGRLRAYLPLWGGGHATHVLAVQLAGGAARGPGSVFGHFGAGGASGSPEQLTGFTLFGGGFVFLPVRGFPRFARAGRYAWSASSEYRFPLALVNRGLGAWPAYLDRVIGSIFMDIGNAWDPNPLGEPIASVGAEVTTQILGFYDTTARLRAGVALPVVSGSGAQVYVRVGLPF